MSLPDLGSSPRLDRIDARFISHEIRHIFHLEKGFLFTIKELLIRPGKAVREYLNTDRTKYVKPILFLIITSLIFTLIAHFFHIQYNFFNLNGIGPLQNMITANEVNEWTNAHVGYNNLLLGVFIALWVRLFFTRHGLNIFEIIVLLCYVMGEAILLLGVFHLFFSLIKSFHLAATFVAAVGVLVFYAYPIWSIGQFFGQKKVMSYIKSALIYVLGVFSHLAFLIITAYLLTYIPH